MNVRRTRARKLQWMVGFGSAISTLSACGGEAPTTTAPTPMTTSTASSGATDAGVTPPPPHGALAYPATRRDATSDVIFGTTVNDPYRWLEDAKNPDVQTWMTAENALARDYLAKLPERASMVARLKELFYVPYLGAPWKRGGRVFYARQTPPQEKTAFYWKDGDKGSERVMLDPNAWSTDGSVSLGEVATSWDGKKVAYGVRHNNSDEATLEVMDVASGKKSDVDVIEGAKYASPSWTAKGDAFYYTYVPKQDGGKDISPDVRPGYQEIRLHILGHDPKTDETIYPRTNDPTTFVGANMSKDGHWLLVYISRGTRSVDTYLRDMRKSPAGKAPFVPLVVGRDSHTFVDMFQDHFYAQTDDGSPNGRIVEIDPAHPEVDKWKELVPERKDQPIRSFGIFGGKLALAYMKDVSTHLEMHTLGDGKLENEIALPGLGTASGLSGLYTDPDMYFTFESYNYPSEVFHYDIKTKKTNSLFKTPMPLDGSKYVVEQQWVMSKDGTRVPMFLVHGKDVQKNGHVPTVMYGYGGFGVNEEPQFSSGAFAWLERGGLYAFPTLRGGGEYGESWHKAGMGHLKQNVFDDAIASAEGLIKMGWTDADHLVARGGSNGGLLVGALVTERPDLFRVGLCGVPLLDMVRYDQFGSGKTWIEEYGTASKADDFPSLFAYSPYHHVTVGTRYPAILLPSADSDDRVDPMHARKFAAALQYASSGGPVLLRIEKNAGHGGADTLKSTLEERADEYAFAWANMSHP